jgi:hypothetical protein
MSAKPRDLKDLFLAPVALAVEENLSRLSELSKADIILRIGLETDMRLDTPEAREDALLKSATHLVDMHGWSAKLTDRGVQLSNDNHFLTLGLGPNLSRFLK